MALKWRQESTRAEQRAPPAPAPAHVAWRTPRGPGSPSDGRPNFCFGVLAMTREGWALAFPQGLGRVRLTTLEQAPTAAVLAG